jgi:hypothetical protein
MDRDKYRLFPKSIKYIRNKVDLKYARKFLSTNHGTRPDVKSPFSNKTIQENMGRLFSRDETRETTVLPDRSRIFSQEVTNRSKIISP